MASHQYAKVIKRTDTPGPAYHIVEKLPGGRTRTVGKSDDRTKANQSAGILSSQRAIAHRGRKR